MIPVCDALYYIVIVYDFIRSILVGYVCTELCQTTMNMHLTVMMGFANVDYIATYSYKGQSFCNVGLVF